MTTVVFDGKVLAADRQLTVGDTRWGARSKIRQLPGGGYFAGSGESELLEEVFCWIKSGMPAGSKPELKEDDGFLALIVREGCVQFLGSRMTPTEVDAPIAIGSGRDFALAAMKCGFSAAKAVEIAAELDTGTGGGVDYVRIKGAKHGSK
jgi:ATP-dependent protease HslVU (ClpYQ) peptidase subunit